MKPTKLLEGATLSDMVREHESSHEVEIVHTHASFLATERDCSLTEACDVIGIDESYFEDEDETTRARVYGGGLFLLTKPDGSAWTIVERDEWEGDVGFVASMLYFDWYVWECIGSQAWSTTMLTRLLDDFCDFNLLPHQCARELQYELMDEESANEHDAKGRGGAFWCARWLEHFCEVWEAAQEREDEDYATRHVVIGESYYVHTMTDSGRFVVEGLATVIREISRDFYLVEFPNGTRVKRMVDAENHESNGSEGLEQTVDGWNSRA